MVKVNLYNAFTKISPPQKLKIIQFLQEQLGADAPSRSAVQQALDYAVKDCPSFGGFVLTAEREEQIICAAVVNETGMDAYLARYIMVLFAVEHNGKSERAAEQILRRAAEYARGDILLRISPENPAFALIEDFGCEASHVEMRLSAIPMAVTR